MYKKNLRRQYLDNIKLTIGVAYPLTVSAFDSHMAKYAAFFRDNFGSNDNTQNKVYFKICNLSTGQEWDNMRFSQMSDVVTWCNNNLSNDGSIFNDSVVMYPFYYIDESIPTITTMYGMNRLYSALRGRRNYQKSSANTAVNLVNTSNITNMLRDMWQHLWGHTIDFNVGLHKQIIWLSARSNRNLYGNYRSDKHIGFNSITGQPPVNRAYYDSGSSSVVICPSSMTSDWIINGQTNGSCHGSININNTSYVVEGASQDSVRKLGVESIMQSNDSVIRGYQVQYSANTDYMIMAVKPVGIDTVVIDYVDFIKYDLLVCGFNQELQQINEKVISTPPPRSDARGGKMMLRKTDWILRQEITSQFSATSNRIVPSVVRFRLRDKKTGAVGEYSPSELVYENNVNYRNSTPRWMVKPAGLQRG